MADTQSDVQVAEDEYNLIASDQPSVSGRKDIDLLRQAVMNEKVSPELLHFEEDLIHRIEAMIDYQVLKLNRAPHQSFQGVKSRDLQQQ